MDRLTIDEIEIQGRRILMRVDFNVPIDNGSVGDDTRIQAAMPTIKKVLSDGGRLILMSHLGRPKGEVKKEFSLKPVAAHLSTLLNKEVKLAEGCVGEGPEKMVNELKDGEVLLLENTRFYKEETANDPDFSKKLAALGEVYVNDAFGAAHREHASTAGVTKFFKESAAGYLLKSEIENLNKLLEAPEKPFVAILGGAKVSDKLTVIHNLVTRVSTILIGGGMAYTFLKANDVEVGGSLLDDERLAMAYNAMVVARIHTRISGLSFCSPRITSSRIPRNLNIKQVRV